MDERAWHRVTYVSEVHRSSWRPAARARLGAAEAALACAVSASTSVSAPGNEAVRCDSDLSDGRHSHHGTTVSRGGGVSGMFLSASWIRSSGHRGSMYAGKYAGPECSSMTSA